MKLFLSLNIALCFLLIYSCSQTTNQSQANTDIDSLMNSVEARLLEKREISQMRDELLNSRLGKSINKYKPIIKKYSKRYGFDWRLIVAQIIQESGFKEKAQSRVGARGLMQLMPYTAKEISRELDIDYIMKNPRENITAGIYHLKKQMRYFPNSQYADRTRLALASYNAGVGRIFDAQSIAGYYKQPANKWNTVKPYIPMLKQSDWELHLQVWPDGQPKYGYFYGYEETINYVEKIWNSYSIYKKIL